MPFKSSSFTYLTFRKHAPCSCGGNVQDVFWPLCVDDAKYGESSLHRATKTVNALLSKFLRQTRTNRTQRSYDLCFVVLSVRAEMQEGSCGISFYGKSNDCGDSDSPFAPSSRKTWQIHTLGNTLILSITTTLTSEPIRTWKGGGGGHTSPHPLTCSSLTVE